MSTKANDDLKLQVNKFLENVEKEIEAYTSRIRQCERGGAIYISLLKILDRIDQASESTSEKPPELPLTAEPKASNVHPIKPAVEAVSVDTPTVEMRGLVLAAFPSGGQEVGNYDIAKTVFGRKPNSDEQKKINSALDYLHNHKEEPVERVRRGYYMRLEAAPAALPKTAEGNGTREPPW